MHNCSIDTVGSTDVLNCESLQIRNIEFPFKEATVENIKKIIMEYRFMNTADYDIHVTDNRPEPTNFNRQREAESHKMKKGNNSLSARRF